MTTQLKTLLAAAVIALAGSHNATATLFFTDQFNYPDGSSLGATTGPWNTVTAGTGDNSTQLKVTTASAQTSPVGYATAAFNGVVVAPAGSNKKNAALFNGATGVPAVVGNVVYASFLLNVQTLPSANMRVAYMHNGSSSSGTMEVIVSSTGQVGIQKKGNAGSLVFASGTPVASPGTHLIVIRYTFITGTSNDELALWVDPSNYGAASAPPGYTTAITSVVSDMSNPFTTIVIDSPGLAVGPVFWIDEVRVATTWAEVTPTSGICNTAAITADPSNVSVGAGAAAIFTVNAGISSSPAYQWQKSTTAGGGIFTNIPSAISASFTNLASSVADNGFNYRCVVSVACDTTTATSAAATLTVSCDTAGISVQPIDKAVDAGQTANFALTATGTSPTYQWQFSTDSGANWAPVTTGTGTNAASYTTPVNTTGQNGYQYRCVVSVACDSSSVTSSVVTLTVSCNTAGISVQPVDTAVDAGQKATFALTATGSSRTYKWEFSTDSGANWAPVTTGTGTNAASFTTVTNTTLQNGYQYRCIVNVACDATSITSSVVTLTVSCNTAGISAGPADLAVLAGSSAAFTVTATGSSISYAWQVSTDGGTVWNSVGTNGSAYTITNATTAGDNGKKIRCIVNVPCDSSSVTSAVATLTVSDVAFRSFATGSWLDTATWEQSTNNGVSWEPAGFTPTAVNCTNITIKSGHTVSIPSNVTADQTVVEAGGTLEATTGNLTVANGTGIDLEILGTLNALGGSSSLTIAASAVVDVGSGGVFVHNGTSGACVNNTAGTVQFAGGGKFQLQRAGGTIPIATWSAGSTCEVAYSTASTSRPATAGLAQTFENFVWNNPLQSGGIDLAAALTNVNGNFFLADSAGQELKWSGDANFGGNLIVSNGLLNISGNSTPRIWTLKGNLIIGPGGTFDLSATASAASQLILNGTGTQNYTCDGVNSAVKLFWTVNSGSTLSLNSDLALTSTGRALTNNGTVNLNGKTLATDLVRGTGTVRNQGGGNGLLVMGVGNSTNTLDGTLTLVDGTSGTFGLVKGGNSSSAGLLTITAPHTFSGGLIISNGFCYVNNTSGSGTGSGGISVLNGTLGGTGTVTGPVVFTAGKLSPGVGGIGTFTVNGILTLAGNTTMDVNKGVGQDQVVATTVNYAGSLTIVTNGSAFIGSDTFPLVSAGSSTGNFTGINGNPGAGLAWSFNPASGVLSIINSIASYSTNVTTTVNGSNLEITWPATHLGWMVEAQTNTLNVGLSSNWFTISNTATQLGYTNAFNPANGAVFYRLRKP